MKTKTLGASNLTVSSICLGCMEFGTRISKADAFDIMDAYFDAGGRFFDTSNNYAFWEPGASGGESEAVLGAWIIERRNRDHIVVATKVGAQPTVPEAGLDAAEGLGREVVLAACDKSLQRLGIDRIDLYYAHIDDPKTPQEETLGAFADLMQAGKINAIGCSNHSLDRLKSARQASKQAGLPAYCCIQQRHSFLCPAPDADLGVQVAVNEEMAAYLDATNDVALVGYSTLLGGVYRTGKLPENYRSDENAGRLARFQQAASDAGVKPEQLAFAATMYGKPSGIPLAAASTPQRLTELLAVTTVSEERLRAGLLAAE